MAIAAGNNEIRSFIFGKPQEFGRRRLLGVKKRLCADGDPVANQISLYVVETWLGLRPGSRFTDRHDHDFARFLQKRKRIANSATALAGVIPGHDDTPGLKQINLVGHKQNWTPGPENGDAWIEGIIQIPWILLTADNDKIGRARFPWNKVIGIIKNSAPFDLLGAPLAAA